jgi:hypothetical protein
MNRLYPGLRARHRRYRRCAFHAFGDSAKHSGQFRRLGPLAVARTPGICGLSGQVILENIRDFSYAGPTKKPSHLATTGFVRSVHGVPDRGPMLSPELHSKDNFHGQG